MASAVDCDMSAAGLPHAVSSSLCDACHGTGFQSPATSTLRQERSASPRSLQQRRRRSSAPEQSTYTSYSSERHTHQPYKQSSARLASPSSISSAWPSALPEPQISPRSRQELPVQTSRDHYNNDSSRRILPSHQHSGPLDDVHVAPYIQDRRSSYMQIDRDEPTGPGRSSPSGSRRVLEDNLDAPAEYDAVMSRAPAAPFPLVPHPPARIQELSRSSTPLSSISSGITLPLYATNFPSTSTVNSPSLNENTAIDGDGRAGSSTSAVYGSGSNPVSNSNSLVPSSGNSTSSNGRTGTRRDIAEDSVNSKRSTNTRPKLPPIKQLLDNIDDWPQARPPRASSVRSSGGSPFISTTSAGSTRLSTHEAPITSHISHTSDSSDFPVFAIPAYLPTQSGNSTFASPKQPPAYRSYHYSDRDYGDFETNAAASTSFASASAANGSTSSLQSWRQRDEQILPQAKKRLKQESRSPSDRVPSLSKDTQHKQNDSDRLSRPSLAARPGRPDKYRSYFADAAVNNDGDYAGHNSAFAFVPNDASVQTMLGEDNVIITPSLENARGDELEAAIHLAGIASSGSNVRPRGALEHIYVTTSSTSAPSSSESHSVYQSSETLQKSARTLHAMGSSSDQASSYGTAPSLTTDTSTFAGSARDGGVFGSPPYSVGPSPDDENVDISPATSADAHLQQQNSQDAQPQSNQQRQRLQSEQQPQPDTDGNSTSNGTGKYFCAVCQKRFTRPSALAVHSHMHTGAKPFACQVCDRSFSVNSNLRRHMKTHSRDEINAAG